MWQGRHQGAVRRGCLSVFCEFCGGLVGGPGAWVPRFLGRVIGVSFCLVTLILDKQNKVTRQQAKQ
jgi:hypothetical protein